MPMIIAGGGAASVYTGEGTATVSFIASGTGRQTSGSVTPTISPVQSGYSCSSGGSVISIPLVVDPVTSGDFLAACITLTDGATVTSITDQIEGYDALVATLFPVAWYKMNELSGTTTYDYGSGDNNGIISGAVVLGEPGPIVGTPSDTSYEFSNTTIEASMLGAGLTGYSLLGGGLLDESGQVAIEPASDLEFGTDSFSIVGWINGTTTAASINGYIFNDSASETSATITRGILGSAVRGIGIMGGGLLESGTGGYSLQMNGGTNQFEFQISDAEGNSISLETPLSYANEWHMVVGVVNRGSGYTELTYRNSETYRSDKTYRGIPATPETMSLYVDGVLIGTDDISSVGSVSNPSTTPTMGDGIVGDLAQVFLTDYALTAAEVEALYLASFETPVGNRWIQAAYSYGQGYGSEIWYARGVKEGLTVVNVTLSTNAQCCANVSEWSGVWYVDPLDQWSQNFGVSGTATTQGVTPRVSSDLFLAAVSAASPIASGPTSGYASLTTGGNGAAAYFVSPYDVSESTGWGLSASSVWAVAHASFVPGASGVNPDFQFPETLIEISTTNNYQQPLEGLGVWTNLSHYVRQMTLGAIGRSHMLDRVQSSPATFTVNNRSGQFNPWNTESHYYNGGSGLKPMNPIKVTSSWLGVTSPVSYTYLQSVTPQISDVLNIDVEIASNDILAMLSLKYLSSNNYAQLVIDDGEAG